MGNWLLVVQLIVYLMLSRTCSFGRSSSLANRAVRFARLSSIGPPGAEATAARAEATANARVNTKVDLTSSKVVSTISVAPGEKLYVCRCWKSSKFPLCDGSHMGHNKSCGDNLGPAMIVGAAAPAKNP
jgi:CDGSH-type Zn-finger protein